MWDNGLSFHSVPSSPLCFDRLMSVCSKHDPLHLSPAMLLPFKTSWWFSGVLVCRKSSWPPLWRDQLSRQQGLKTGTMRPFSSFDRQPSTQTAEAFVSRKPRCRSSPCALAVFGCFWLLLVLREGREQRLCVYLCVRTWLTAIKGKSTL